MQVFFLAEFGWYLFLLLQITEQYFLEDSLGVAEKEVLHSWHKIVVLFRSHTDRILSFLGLVRGILACIAEQDWLQNVFPRLANSNTELHCLQCLGDARYTFISNPRRTLFLSLIFLLMLSPLLEQAAAYLGLCQCIWDRRPLAEANVLLQVWHILFDTMILQISMFAGQPGLQTGFQRITTSLITAMYLSPAISYPNFFTFSSVYDISSYQ